MCESGAMGGALVREASPTLPRQRSPAQLLQTALAFSSFCPGSRRACTRAGAMPTAAATAPAAAAASPVSMVAPQPRRCSCATASAASGRATSRALQGAAGDAGGGGAFVTGRLGASGGWQASGAEPLWQGQENVAAPPNQATAHLSQPARRPSTATKHAVAPASNRGKRVFGLATHREAGCSRRQQARSERGGGEAPRCIFSLHFLSPPHAPSSSMAASAESTSAPATPAADASRAAVPATTRRPSTRAVTPAPATASTASTSASHVTPCGGFGWGREGAELLLGCLSRVR